MKNAIFFIVLLHTRGIEAKLVRNFLPLLKERGKMNPKLLLLQEKGKFLKELPPYIEKFNLNETASDNLISIIPKFRNAIKKMNTDVVISCMWYPAIISYTARKLGLVKFKHIVHDTVNMTEFIKNKFSAERFKKLKLHLILNAYKNANALVLISKVIKSDLVTNYRISEKKYMLSIIS